MYNPLVVLDNNYNFFDINGFLRPQTPTMTYIIHMTHSLNYNYFFCCCLFMTILLLFYEHITSFPMGCILRFSRVKTCNK